MTPNGTFNIMVVDDDTTYHHALLAAIADFENKAGLPPLNVTSATSPEEAVKIMRQEMIHAVVSDLRFAPQHNPPDAVTGGLELLSLARTLAPAAIQVLGSYSDPPNEKTESLHFIRKTADANQWANKLRRIIANKICPAIISFPHFDVRLYQALIDNPHLMQDLDWRRFEELMAELLLTMNYEVELTQPSKGGGVDLFAIRRSDPMGDHRYILQAKRSKKRIGVEPVRELLFLHNHHGASKSCLATTSHFTKGAWDLANIYPWQLELKDQDRLIEWVRHARDVHLNAIANKRVEING